MGQYLAPDLTAITEEEEDMLIKRNVTVVSTAIDASSAEVFETNVSKLVTDECGNPFPAFTATPLLTLTPLGDYDIILVKVSEDATSDKINSATSGHTFKLYIGAVGVPPADAVYKVHMAWIRC